MTRKSSDSTEKEKLYTRIEVKLLKDISAKLDYLIILHREEDLKYPFHDRYLVDNKSETYEKR